MIWHFTIWGAPRTKKTHNQIVRAGKKRPVLPSPAWRKWCALARIEIDGRTWIVRTWPLVEQPVNCRAHFYRDANRGDAVGYYQGLADLLEKRGVLADDKLIAQWDGSRLFVDRAHPRVEIVLEAVA